MMLLTDKLADVKVCHGHTACASFRVFSYADRSTWLKPLHYRNLPSHARTKSGTISVWKIAMLDNHLSQTFDQHIKQHTSAQSNRRDLHTHVPHRSVRTCTQNTGSTQADRRVNTSFAECSQRACFSRSLLQPRHGRCQTSRNPRSAMPAELVRREAANRSLGMVLPVSG